MRGPFNSGFYSTDFRQVDLPKPWVFCLSFLDEMLSFFEKFLKVFMEFALKCNDSSINSIFSQVLAIPVYLLIISSNIALFSVIFTKFAKILILCLSRVFSLCFKFFHPWAFLVRSKKAYFIVKWIPV